VSGPNPWKKEAQPDNNIAVAARHAIARQRATLASVKMTAPNSKQDPRGIQPRCAAVAPANLFFKHYSR